MSRNVILKLEEENFYYCLPCKQKLTNYGFHNHSSAKKHQNNEKAFTLTDDQIQEEFQKYKDQQKIDQLHFIHQSDDNSWLCLPCTRMIGNNGKARHKSSKAHIENAKSYIVVEEVEEVEVKEKPTKVLIIKGHKSLHDFLGE